MKLGLGTVLLLITACAGSNPPPNPPPPADDPDAAANPVTCSTYCKHVGPEGLDCPEGRPTAKGATCMDFCSNIQLSRNYVRLDLRCSVKAKTCAEVASCEH